MGALAWIQVLELMELATLRNAMTGLPGVTGLSVEQRKRLTIGVELVANPSIIFMVRALLGGCWQCTGILVGFWEGGYVLIPAHQRHLATHCPGKVDVTSRTLWESPRQGRAGQGRALGRAGQSPGVHIVVGNPLVSLSCIGITCGICYNNYCCYILKSFGGHTGHKTMQ
jgi:hypothetical protein